MMVWCVEGSVPPPLIVHNFIKPQNTVIPTIFIIAQRLSHLKEWSNNFILFVLQFCKLWTLIFSMSFAIHFPMFPVVYSFSRCRSAGLSNFDVFQPLQLVGKLFFGKFDNGLRIWPSIQNIHVDWFQISCFASANFCACRCFDVLEPGFERTFLTVTDNNISIGMRQRSL